MHAAIDWGEMGEAALASLIGTVVFVTAFSLMVLASSYVSAARLQSRPAPVAAFVLAAVAGLVCLAAVGAGLYGMLDKS